MTTVEFDPFSPTFFDDPYPVYRRLRDEAPLYRNDAYGFVALSRWDDVVQAHRDWETFSSAHGVGLDMLTSPDPPAPPPSMIMMDPPAHHHMRGLVNRVFTPRAVADLEPMVRSVIDRRLDERRDGADFDAVVDFAGPFPVEIICRMLGVPPADHQRIRQWVDDMLHREPGEVGATDTGRDAVIEWGTYMYRLVVDKRAHPGDDMLSRLCQVSVERDDGERTGLTDVEITGFALLLSAAGSETVTKLVGSAIVLFARNPGEWRKVLDDPARIPGAVEEALRYWPPSQYQGRMAARPSRWHGETVEAGTPVLLLTGAATHDERAFADPDRFDVDRAPATALGFGHGIHTCLGAALARLEAKVALEAWRARFERFGVDEGGLRRVEMANVAGYSHVPVSVGT